MFDEWKDGALETILDEYKHSSLDYDDIPWGDIFERLHRIFKETVWIPYRWSIRKNKKHHGLQSNTEPMDTST